VLGGEQGSAKSTLARALRALVDPNAAPLRSAPRDGRDLIIAAMNSWVLSFDNLSGIPLWLSDALCRIATGGGFATRELYTDSEEVIFSATRPVIVNGIDDLATRGDLRDRAIVLTLPNIDESKRRSEADLWRQFERVRGRILGAMLDAVSAGLRREPTVKLDSLPRMADFARWVVACGPALGVEPETFMMAYRGNRAAAVDLGIETSPVGPALVAMISTRLHWCGTATELLEELSSDSWTDETTRRRRSWPQDPRALSGMLRRLAPDLRSTGIEVEFGREPGGGRRRTIRLEKSAVQPPRPSRPSQFNAGNAESGNPPGRDEDDNRAPPSHNRPAEKTTDSQETQLWDGGDDQLPKDLGHPLVPPGWAPERWRERLLLLADRCEPMHPDKAVECRVQAASIEAARDGRKRS
jgi:hypothetical protein